jgi:hypothetical protein
VAVSTRRRTQTTPKSRTSQELISLDAFRPKQAKSNLRPIFDEAIEQEFERLNFQILRRTVATQAQRMGSVKDIQAHLRHARPNTTAYEYMQEQPESVQEMVGSMYEKLWKGEDSQKGVAGLLPTAAKPPKNHAVSC